MSPWPLPPAHPRHHDHRISVTPVRTRADRTAFIRQPYPLYRGDPHWVCPLEHERRRFLDPRHNPFFDFGTAQLFLARRHGRPVGRIAAVLNPHHNQVHGTNHGFFGLFECVNDQATAHALITAAHDWLRQRGHHSMLGPVNFSTNYECGLLVDGFDDPPTILMPHNPAYYPTLLENCGLTKAKDLWSWRLPTTTAPVRRLGAVADAVRRRPGLRVRPLNRRALAAEIARIKDVYHSAWQHHWGFSPMTDREFDHLADTLRPVLVPDLVRIAEVHGEPAGFALLVPDANQAIRAAHGRLTSCGLPLGLIRMLRAARTVHRVRAVAVGVKERYRGRGLEVLFYVDLLRAAQQRGYTEMDISWTLEDNHAANRAIAALDATRTKTHRIYQLDQPPCVSC